MHTVADAHSMSMGTSMDMVTGTHDMSVGTRGWHRHEHGRQQYQRLSNSHRGVPGDDCTWDVVDPSDREP